jgi:hypothetical protein
MRKATKTTAMWLGIIAGLAGLEHGYFEFLQGDVPPPSLVFPSMGPPCVPEQVWNACEPAVTVLPSLGAAGILTVLLGLLIILWSAFFIQSKYGGIVLILLSALLLPAGGGVFPPIIGLIGGIAGKQVNKPITNEPAGVTRFAAKLWPWPLVIFLVWVLGQWVIGYFFNDFLKSNMGFGLLLILSILPLSVYCAYAHDVVQSIQERD